MIFDLRCLVNPYWEPALRSGSGLDETVRTYILNDPGSRAYLQQLTELVSLQAHLAAGRGCRRLRIGLGCTGGRHRSVTASVLLAERLQRDGFEVTVKHRDLALG